MARYLRRLYLIHLLQILLVAVAGAQIGAGRAEVRGVVTEIDGDPIAGARVTLTLANRADAGPKTVETDSRGRWRIGGLAEGRWDLVIKARDFVTVEGWVQSSTGRSEGVEVWMRPLAEVSAAFAESSSSVLRWLEKGNSLLEQGQYPAARQEYEKALGAVPRASWAKILQSMARTYYLEGDLEAAIRTLQWALVIDPADLISNQLYSNLLDQLGRGPEAEEFLSDLRARSPAELEELADQYGSALPKSQVTGPPTAVGIEVPIDEPEAGRSGSYRVRFEEKSPQSSLELLLQRLDLELADVEAIDPDRGRYDLEAESFRVFVPPSYSQGEDFGLFVWISPTPSGGFVSPEMRRALEASRLIWVGADRAGNGRARWYRYLLALDAAHNMRQLYRIDENRIFVGGYSGGGRVTSGLAMLYPEVFRGGFSLSGCDYPELLPVPDKPGAYWPPGFPTPPKRTLREVKSSSRFVLLTGELDFNRAQTRKTYLRMLDDGFEHVLYLRVSGASHYDHPDEATLTQGFSFLVGEPVGP